MTGEVVSRDGFGANSFSPELARELVYEMEDVLRSVPQAIVEVEHVFSDGLYSRTILIPAGHAMTGRKHRHDDLNVIAYGDISVLVEDGTMRRITGPARFTGKAGVKQLGISHADTLWTTVHATTLTDLAAIEAELFEDEKSMFDFASGELRKEELPCHP
jgi:hypothetical protein